MGWCRKRAGREGDFIFQTPGGKLNIKPSANCINFTSWFIHDQGVILCEDSIFGSASIKVQVIEATHSCINESAVDCFD